MVAILVAETEPLRLRQWLASDREPFAQLNADATVMQYFPQPLARADSDAMADRCQQLIAQRGWGFWAVELKLNRQFIGFVGLHIPSADLPCSPCVEIGWRLARPYWGQGLATEAAQRALHIGFASLNMQEIVAFSAVQNLRSQAVMQRLGMQQSTVVFDHPSMPVASPLRRHCLYRLSRQQWQARGSN